MYKMNNDPKISLTEYLHPSQEIEKAVDDLTMYYQLCEQDALKEWVDRKDKNTLSGKNFDEFLRLVDIDEFMKFKDNAIGSTFIKARFLLDKFSSEFDTKRLINFDDEQVQVIIRMIRNGAKAKTLLEEWLKPISEGEIAIAIDDALSIDLKNKFQILKLEQISEPNFEKPNDFEIYPYILDIESAAEIAHFLRIQKTVRDCLILTLQRNKLYQFKSDFYLFLIYNGILYSIDNSDKRLNINNTKGCRNPDRYLEDKYDKVWLPFRILSSKRKTDETALVVKGTKVYKIDSLDNIAKDFPETLYWLYIFLGRVVNYINTEKVELGVTTSDNTKLLTYSKNEFKIEGAGAGSYLEEIYASKCKDIVVQEKHLPNIIGTQKFISDIIGYRKRELIAKILNKTVQNDHKRNAAKVYNEIRAFVKDYPIDRILKKAKLNAEYEYMNYKRFGSTGPDTGILKERIMYIADESLWQYTDKNNIINITGDLYSNHGRKRTACVYDKKFQWKKIIRLDFIDYQQFLEFFEISENDIPSQMKQHLHQQSELYVGNPILNDTDPVDEIKDPWFREHENRMGGPLLRVAIPICNRCLKKLGFYDKT